jgi:polyhydroxyalkanoate synthase
MIDALQHRTPGPHPLPLFLDLVAQTAMQNAELARAALDGLRVYSAAPRPARRQRPITDREGRARLFGQRQGRPVVVLIPSLINGSAILDLSPDLSLIDWLDGQGFDGLLLDWGVPTPADAGMAIDDHVTQLLMPLLQRLGEPVHLLGYCLGGTIAAAAAHLVPVKTLTLLATPWHFDGYPPDARAAMMQFWHDHRGLARSAGAIPIEWLQPLFWGLDPERTVAKYAALAGLDADHPDVLRFTLVEDWSNSGAPLPWQAGQQLFEGMIRDDITGRAMWTIAGQKISIDAGRHRAAQIAATDDRIVPSATMARAVSATSISGGHVGMIVGRHRVALRQAIAEQLQVSA